MNKNPSCPKCRCAEVVKNGKVKEKQRIKCKSCSFQFTLLTPREHPANEKALAIVLYTLGLSMNAISKLFGISAYSVLRWVRNFAVASQTLGVPPQSRGLTNFWLGETLVFLGAKEHEYS